LQISVLNTLFVVDDEEEEERLPEEEDDDEDLPLFPPDIGLT
jgi:hypothetical protein